MTSLFGIPMNDVMIALLILLGIAVATVGWVVLRNRVLFLIGVRNIPRRRAQTTLIIVGLMLSTLIIAAAFSIGDTVNYSITNEGFDQLHSIDETVQAQAGSSDAGGLNSVVSPLPIPQAQADRFAQAFRAMPGIDGAVPVVRGSVPVTDQRSGLAERSAVVAGADPAQMAGFPDIQSTGGALLSLAALGPDEVYVNSSLASKLDAKPGDRVTVYVGGKPTTFTVKAIVKDRVLTGTVFGQPQGMAMSLARAQELFRRPGEVDFIAVSNNGGVHGGITNSTAITAALNQKLAALGGTKWKADATKQHLVNQAEKAASGLTAFFVVLGLFSIASGMLLIFLIFVMLAAERKMEMGMTRAIGTKRRHLMQMFLSEGMAYNLMAAAVGCALGVAVSLVMVRVMAALFSQFNLSIVFHVTARSLVVSYALGVVLTFLTVTFSSWRISSLNIVSAIRDISDASGKRPGRWSLAFGLLFAVGGPLLLWLGVASLQAFPYMLGITLLAVGLALLARFVGLPSRPVFTVAGVFLVGVWLVGAGNHLPPSGMNGGIEMFFLSGIAMVTASTFVLVYNADLLLLLLSFSGGAFSKLTPSIRTAVAYPLANKFRTGMTIAMISLVVFALVMMSTMNANFSRIFLSKEALGGYDVQVQQNPNNPIPDLKAELAKNGFDTTAIKYVSPVLVANARASNVRMAPPPGASPGISTPPYDFAPYRTLGMSASFIQHNAVTFQSRADGFATDAAVWRALAENPGYAVIDASSLGGAGFNFGGGSRFRLRGVRSADTTFAPIAVEVRDAATGATRSVKIIGIITLQASETFSGLFLTQQTFDAAFTRPATTVDFVKLAPGANAQAAAKGIEKALLLDGVQADALRTIIDQRQALSQGFLYLIQGFMGLGLFVGIAAVGVIAFRTVVERRQQIGMLRAIGYTKAAVALSFVMESSFIALLGVLSGISLGLLLAHQLITGADFAPNAISGFYIPWLQVAGIGLFAFLASLVMTIIPSRQASSIPIAEALRYE